MSRLIMAGAIISAALGSALALPMAAQASTVSNVQAAISAIRNVSPDLNGGGSWQYVATYPTLAACNAEGAYLIYTYPKTDETYTCHGTQLWVYFDPTGF